MIEMKSQRFDGYFGKPRPTFVKICSYYHIFYFFLNTKNDRCIPWIINVNKRLINWILNLNVWNSCLASKMQPFVMGSCLSASVYFFRLTAAFQSLDKRWSKMCFYSDVNTVSHDFILILEIIVLFKIIIILFAIFRGNILLHRWSRRCLWNMQHPGLFWSWWLPHGLFTSFI